MLMRRRGPWSGSFEELSLSYTFPLRRHVLCSFVIVGSASAIVSMTKVIIAAFDNVEK